MKKQLSITARRCIIATLLFPLWGLGGLGSGFGLFAQVSVSNMATTYTANNNKIAFTITWTQQPHNNQIWVITDYIKVAGTATTGSWSRALIAGLPTATGNATAATVTGINRGFWLNTSGSSGSANVTATLSLAAGVDKFNWCAYALNTPPQAVLVTGGGYELKGTPPFVVNGTKLGDGVKTFGAGTCITTLTDATNNPTSILPAPLSISRSGGNASQTVTQNSAITAITYTATNASSMTLSGSLPNGLSYGWSSNKYVISGSPTAAGTFPYSVTTANSQNCTNDIAYGTITVNNPAITYTGCTAPSITLGTVGFTSSATYIRNGLTISSPVTATYCANRCGSFDGGLNPAFKADCAPSTQTGCSGHLFSWCMVVQYAAQLCPPPWRVPTKADHCKIVNNDENNCYGTPNLKENDVGYVRCGYAAAALCVEGSAAYWSSTSADAQQGYALSPGTSSAQPGYINTKRFGYALRCVR